MTDFKRFLRGLRFAAFIGSVMMVAACASNPNDPNNPGGSAATPGSAQDFVGNVGDRVFFENDSTALNPQARATLVNQAPWLSQYNPFSFTIDATPAVRASPAYTSAPAPRPP